MIRVCVCGHQRRWHDGPPDRIDPSPCVGRTNPRHVTLGRHQVLVGDDHCPCPGWRWRGRLERRPR